jgi:heme-degrading monooxygenase HmoA
MYARLNDTSLSPDRIDDLVEFLANKVVPVVTAQPGSRGLAVSANRSTGRCGIASYWDDRQTLEASEVAITSLRQETVAAVDATITQISIAEIVRVRRDRPSQLGMATRSVLLGGAASQLDELLGVYDSENLPRLAAQSGFCGALLFVNRDTNQVASLTIWQDEQALTASEATSAALRQEITSRGVTIDDVQTGEIVLVELR